MINNDKIYLSYYKEIKKNCFNISIVGGSLDLELIKFKSFLLMMNVVKICQIILAEK